MEGMASGEIVIWVGLFLIWWSGVTLFHNVEALEWAIYPWTLLVFAGTLGIIFGSAWMSDDAKDTMLIAFGVIDVLLVFFFPGFVMIRIGGKWKYFGITLVCIPPVVIAGFVAFYFTFLYDPHGCNELPTDIPPEIKALCEDGKLP